MADESDLHIVTPLVRSDPMTKELNKGPIFLKLDCLQPSGSFKIRGIGATCRAAKKSGSTKIVGSSGGNAGMAMAYAAKKLNMKAKLFVPETTPPMMIDKITKEGADVMVGGENWNAANSEAIKFLNQDPEASFVHPYDQETTWVGHASIIKEIRTQIRSELGGKEIKPAAIITVVGGGGLATGTNRFMKFTKMAGNSNMIFFVFKGYCWD